MPQTECYQIILCTCPNQALAITIANTLVSEHLVACVNVMPQITSIYQWQGKIEQDSEVLLIAKTLKTKFEDVSARIQQLHSYDVPEVIAIDIQQGSSEYLNWISNSLK